MNIDDVKQRKLVLFESISGSKAYGLDTPQSDTDIKGVFILPKHQFYKMEYIKQVSDEKNDQVYYELGRYIELLAKNNPNIIELLNSPNHCIQYQHPLMTKIQKEFVLSKLCKNTFGQFALSQIKKAKGLNKKIVNPMPKERKSILSFCHVQKGQGSIPLEEFLRQNKIEAENCGLINIPHMKDMFALFHSEEAVYEGLVSQKKGSQLLLSSIPKGQDPKAILHCNHQAYSKYCKDYKEYWKWVEDRNDQRFIANQLHGKNYDAKNMMHTFRLLDMALEIATTKQVNVARPNRELLLKIKSGVFEYEELLELANKKSDELEAAYKKSSLANKPQIEKLQEVHVQIRMELYKNPQFY
ncbi:MAG: nucleotidyltransferase domain-containing protein [Lentisphaeria bacterium]|nr:nucleotidyltransferase domain-containing protein [Lentisphaeria bacterium]